MWKWREGVKFKRVVFVAGGVGVNPLMSMVSFIAGEVVRKNGLDGGGERVELEVRFLYSSRGGEGGEEVLFLRRLGEVFKVLGRQGELSLFLTGSKEEGDESIEIEGQKITARKRRISDEDLLEALGPVEGRGKTLCYICGVPTMTDEFVEKTRKAEGMLEEHVLFEKWW